MFDFVQESKFTREQRSSRWSLVDGRSGLVASPWSLVVGEPIRVVCWHNMICERLSTNDYLLMLRFPGE
jgi:hypothetical protein